MWLPLVLAACAEPTLPAAPELVEPTNDTGGSDCSEAPYADAIVGTREELVAALGSGGLVALLPGDYGTLDLTGIDARITGICRDRTRFTELAGPGEFRRMVVERYGLSAGRGTLSDVVLGSAESSGELQIDDSTVENLTVEGVALISGTDVSGTVAIGAGQVAIVSGTVSGAVTVTEATVLLRSVSLTGSLVSAGTLGATGGTIGGTLVTTGTAILDGSLLSGGTLRVEGGTLDAEDVAATEGAFEVSGGVATVVRSALAGASVRGGLLALGNSTVEGAVVVTGGSFAGEDLLLEGTPYALGVSAEASCEGCDFAGEVGVVVTGGSLTLVEPDFDVAGIGVWSRDGTIVLDDGVVAGGAIAGVWTEGGSLSVAQSWFEEGHCLVVREGTELRADAAFERCAVGVLLDAATGDFTGSSFVANPVDVWRQRCDGIPAPTGVGDATVVDCAGTIDLPAVEWSVPP